MRISKLAMLHLYILWPAYKIIVRASSTSEILFAVVSLLFLSFARRQPKPIAVNLRSEG
jgi:hypothetical protein